MKKYKTEVENFYMFVSHSRDGKANVSYGLVKNDGLKMVEIIPGYGPITVLHSDKNVVEDYMFGKCDRSNWSQRGYDEMGINRLLKNGEFNIIANYLENNY